MGWGYAHSYSFIHFRYLYSASSRFLLRGDPDYSADTESEFHAEAHEQLRVKDLSRVPMRRLEVDSNPQPSGCKAPNISLHHRVSVCLCESVCVSAYLSVSVCAIFRFVARCIRDFCVL